MNRFASCLAVLGLAVLATACDEDSPTAPSSAAAAAASAVTVQLCASASPCPTLPGSLQIGDSMTLYVVVTSTSQSVPSEAGITTTLGSFGSDGAGNPITQQTLSLSGTNSTRSAAVTFEAGDSSGTASIAANVGSVTGSASVVISETPGLFLQSVTPNVGGATGGETVVISGQGFDSGARIAFGGVQADPPTTVTDTTIRVVVPPPSEPVSAGSTLTVDVQVTNPPESSGATAASDTLPKAYTYSPGGAGVGPVIISVVPGQGENSGGTSVTILGDNFPSASAPSFSGIFVAFGSGDDAASFSGIPITPTSVSSTQIQLTTPPAGATFRNSTVDVLVRDQGTGLSSLAKNAFTYGTQDLVLDVQPRQLTYLGSQDCSAGTGSDCVVVTAQGLPADMPQVAVEFGGVPQATCSSTATTACAVSYNASTTTTTLTIKAAAVTVTNCSPPSGGVTVTDQQTGESSSGPVFSYTAEQPIVTGTSPSSGSQGGGETVSVQGTFSTSDSPVVRIGGVQATVLTTTASAINVTAPAFTGTFNTVACGSAGTQQVPTAVDVEVVYPGTGCSATGTGSYVYQPDSTDCMDTTPPTAAFTFEVDDETLTVTFTDLSGGDPTGWLWDFGDGSTVSTEQNPVHTYDAAGEYTVTLTASNGGGTDSIQQTVSVGVAPEASFTFQVGGSVSPPPPCDLGLYVRFTDTSTGNPTAWSWDFGDGDSSTEQSPDHCYDSAGMRTVTLTVSNAQGSDSTSQVVTTTN